MTLDQVLDAIVRSGAVAAALGAIALLLARLLDRAVVKPIKELIKDQIGNELRPNGGSSMRDAVNRIEHAQETAHEHTLHLHQENQRAILALRADVCAAGIEIPEE